MKIILFFRFYGLRLLRQQPWAIGALLVAFFLMIGCLLVLGGQASQIKLIEARLAGLPRNSPLSAQSAPVLDGAPSYLREFDGSAILARLYESAEDIGFPMEEVSYELESAPTQPYLRYRVSLRAKASYAEVRRFAAALLVDLPNISLDSLRCARDEIATIPLNCELAFSAFYKKGGGNE